MADKQGQLPVLDGLRAVSIVFVLAAHLLPLGPKALGANSMAGASGMALFFSLSGFLIASQLHRGTPVSAFLQRRLARILPLAYAYLVIAAILLGLTPSYPGWTALFVVNYATEWLNASYNSHFWSLCVEVHFYILIATAVALGGTRALFVVWPACLAITVIRVMQGEPIAIQTHLRADEILVGACVAAIYPRIRKWMWREASFFGAFVAWLVCSHPEMGPLQYLRPYATGSLLLVTLGLGGGWVKNVLSSRPMGYVADVSYGLYVIHPITAHGWMNEGSPFQRYVLKRPLSLALTFAIAHISRFTWEKYWINAARQGKKLAPRSPSPTSG